MEIELLSEHPCTMCTHYRGGAKCSAYQDGIPTSIIDNFDWGVGEEEGANSAPSPNDTNDHRLPINGDNGIQWQAEDADDDIELRTAWWGSDRSKWPVNPHGR